MSALLPIIAKTTLLFLLTLACFRLMGYRSLGDMEPLDYVIVLGIGEILGSPLSENGSVVNAAGAIILLTVFQLSLSAVYARFPRLSRVIEGKPIPVISNGRILRENLRRARVDLSTLEEELRVKGVRDEGDVDMAFLEPSGRFSVILKNEVTPITPRFMNKEASLILVEKGEIRPENWENEAVKEAEILAFLRGENIVSWEEVDSLILKEGQYFLQRKKKQEKEEKAIDN